MKGHRKLKNHFYHLLSFYNTDCGCMKPNKSFQKDYKQFLLFIKHNYD